MGNVEEWLGKRHKLSQDDKRVLDDLRAHAMFALYCQIGSGKGSSGTCMSDFGALVAKRAYRFSVETKDLFQELLAEAAEKANRGEWDV